ncbi:unnamed protein product [Brassica oleracea var. botrytis]
MLQKCMKALFLYEKRHTLCSNSEGSIWRKLKSLFRIFDEKDIRSHTFKSSAVHNVSSPITQCTPSHLTADQTMATEHVFKQGV